MKIKKIVLASQNAKKIQEIRDILSPLSIELSSAKALGIPDIEETGQTFIENAILKARHVASHVPYPVIADDSGLVVDALKGAPGIYSARYAGSRATNDQRIAKLLRALANVHDDHRLAYFYSAIVFFRYANDPMPIIAQGLWQGSILKAPIGTHGLGYDPIFYVPTHNVSAAQLEPAIKNKLSHRYRALAQLMEQLVNLQLTL
jgi:XTP/dITP diphosphohydrolase